MKANKVLFIIAGILKSLASGLMLLLGVAIFALNGFVKQFLLLTEGSLDEFITGLIDITGDNQDLLNQSVDEKLNFVMGIVRIAGVVVLVVGVLWLLLAILNFQFARYDLSKRKAHKGKAILFMILSWLVSAISLSNILSTIAIAMKPKAKVSLAEDIPNFQIC